MVPRLSLDSRTNRLTGRVTGNFSARRASLLLAAVAALLSVACGERPAKQESVVALDAHVFAHEPSGVGLELPAIWAGKYQVTDSITVPAAGLERELSLRLIRADSSLVSEPLVVIRVFSNAGYESIPADSAGKLWGTVVAKDAARTLVVRPAPANPLTAAMPDASTFDSMIISLLGRPMKASLRAPGR